MQTRTLTVTFDLPLRYYEIPWWRGAFIEMAGRENVLLHNHKDGQPDQYVRCYPKVQYRCIGRRAGIYAYNEGIDALQDILERPQWTIDWKEIPTELRIHSLNMEGHYLQMTTKPQSYRIRRWLPLNNDNIKIWKAAANLRERIGILEKILTGQILGACEGFEYHVPKRLKVELQQINHTGNLQYKDIQMVGFDIEYTANILLPYGMGMGKGTSVGFGFQKTIKEQQKGTVPIGSGATEIQVSEH